MKKLIKRTFIGFGILTGLVLMVLLLAPIFFSGPLKKLVQKQVNAQIEGEMIINGAAGLSLLRHFPEASVSFHDIIIHSKDHSDTLLATSRVSFLFDIVDLFRGQYNITKLSLGDTKMNLHTNEQGTHNYDIFKPDTTIAAEPQETDLSINIREFSFQSISLQYSNRQNAQEMQVNVANGLVSLDYNNRFAEIMLQADVLPGLMVFGTVPYELPKKMQLTGGLQIDEENAVYRFSNTRLTVEGDIYELDGLLEEKSYGLWVDVVASGKEVGMKSLWALAASNGIGNDWEVNSNGDLDFKATVKGALGSGRTPAIEAFVELKDGRISSSAVDGDLEKVLLTGHYTNGSGQSMESSRFELSRWQGELKGYPFSISGQVENFTNPVISANVDGTFDGSAIGQLAASFGFNDLAGTIQCEGLQLQSDLGTSTSINGVVKVKDLAFERNDHPFSAGSGTLTFQEDDLFLKADRWQAGASDFTMEGTIKHWASIWQVSAKSKASVKLTVRSAYQDWKELHEIFAPPATETAGKTVPTDYLAYLQQIRGDVNLVCTKFSAGTFDADDLMTEVTLRPYLLTLDTAHMNTSDGRLIMKGTGRYLGDELVFQADLTGHKVNVKKLFASFDNFWQDYLVDDNLSGQVNGTVNGILAFDRQLQLKTEKLDIEGHLTVVDGHLRDFEPLQQLSSFVKMKELKDIKFSTLKNVVLVKGDRVILPVMAIKSTAMNLWLSGEYFYDETIDYQFKIDLMDVLARKFSLGNTSLRDAERREEGLVNLYVSMRGPVDDPVIETNKNLVMERFYDMNLYREDEFVDFNEIEQRQKPRAVNPKKYDDSGEPEFIEDW